MTAAELRGIVEHLASFERASASAGEKRAAAWIADRFRDLGLVATVEEERAHGGYWWPLGILSTAAGVAGLVGRRRAASVVGALSTAGLWDELHLLEQRRTRRLLPKRTTYNVMAVAGDPHARRTVVISAHHDAPHSGVVFDSRAPRAVLERFPALIRRVRTWPRVMWPVFIGPALVTAGAVTGIRALRRAGTVLSLGSAAAMADIGMRDVVPGANDNLSGVATVLGVAATLAERPVAGLRVVLLSTGSEESFLEGMSAFARRHADEFADADWLVIEMVGSSGLIVPEGEGFLFERGYDPDLRALLIRAAADCAIDVDTDVGVAFTSDAHILLRRGHRAALLGSYDHVRMPVAYHTPDDTPDRLDYDAVADAVRLLDTTVRLIAQR